MTVDVSPVEALTRSAVEHGKEMGRFEERTRIARVIGSFPLTACVCESSWKSLGVHALDCQREAEATFRTRLIEALFTTAPAGPDGSGVSPTGNSGLAGAVAAISPVEAA